MKLLLCLTLLVSAHAEFRAGAAKLAITPDLQKHGPVYMAGFGQNRVATGIHDDLWARCVALDTANKPVVLCSVDLIGLFLDDAEKVRQTLRREFPGVNVVVSSTHVHEGPDTMGQWGPSQLKTGINETYMAYAVERIAQCGASALRSLTAAQATLAVVKTAELDGFIDDGRPPVVHDPDLIVLRLRDRKGTALATVVNWANHPETLGSKNTLITADYPAAFYPQLEKRLGGVALLWNGAVGGMQSPLGAKVTDPETGKVAPADSFRMAEIIGQRVANLAADSVAKPKRAAIDTISYAETDVVLPLQNKLFQMAFQMNLFAGRKKPGADGTSTTTRVGALRLGNKGKPVLDVALVPGEMYPELSLGGIVRYPGADFPEAPLETPVKSMMSAPYRMLIGLANDEIGYIIPKAEWDEVAPFLNNSPRRLYGEVNSVGPETAPTLARALAALFKQ